MNEEQLEERRSIRYWQGHIPAQRSADQREASRARSMTIEPQLFPASLHLNSPRTISKLTLSNSILLFSHPLAALCS